MMTVIYIMLAGLVLAGLYFIVPYMVRNILLARFVAKIGQSHCICLTFDDGPNPESTPEILSLLNELAVKATFFLIGRNVEKYPDLCHEIIRHGHEVGDHGYRHVHAWKCLPSCAILDLLRGHRVLKKYAGSERAFWLRLPYGKLDLITLCYIFLSRRKLAFWNVDPRDYRPQSPENLSAKVLQNNITGGAVILLHERSFQAHPELKGNLEALKTIIQEFKKRGYPFIRISEAAGGIPIKNEEKYEVKRVGKEC